jgi:hypothetical protein
MDTSYSIKINGQTVILNENEYYAFINQFNSGNPDKVNDLRFIEKIEALIKITDAEIKDNKEALITLDSKKATLKGVLYMIKEKDKEDFKLNSP